MIMITYSIKYDENTNTLRIINDNTDEVYETFNINPSTLNHWCNEQEALDFGSYRIAQIVATSPMGVIVKFVVSILDSIGNNVSIIKRNTEYTLILEAISNDVRVDFDHAGILLECSTSNDNKLYFVPFIDGIGKVNISFTNSGIYTFNLDSIRDSSTKKLLTELYPNIQKNDDLVIAVADNV